MKRTCRKYCCRTPRPRAAAGLSLVEIVVSIAVMAILATALGSLLSATTYQSARALVDQRVNMLVNREINFFRSVPYSDLVKNPINLADESGDGTYMSWEPQPISDPQAQGCYVSQEGADGNSYLLTMVDGTGAQVSTMCRYHYLITRMLNVYSDHATVTLSLDWWGPSPEYQKFMNQALSPVGANGDWQHDASTAHQQIAINPIYRNQ